MSLRAGVLLAALWACAPALRYRMPTALHGYAILVPVGDSLSDQLARALERHGVRVERRIRGGSGPTAALIHFTFRESPPAETAWLLVRLADTRTGVIVGEASLQLDLLPGGGVGRAEAILDSLGLTRATPS